MIEQHPKIIIGWIDVSSRNGRIQFITLDLGNAQEVSQNKSFWITWILILMLELEHDGKTSTCSRLKMQSFKNTISKCIIVIAILDRMIH